MRLFVALELTVEVRARIAELIEKLKQLDSSWKWTRSENLHITLKFLGEVPEGKVETVSAALREVIFSGALELNFRGLGFFPNERRPRVLWMGIHAPAALPALAASIDSALERVGVAREERAYTPHLTLARSKEGRVSHGLREALAEAANRDFGKIAATAFQMVRSELKSTGAEYTTLATFPNRPKIE